MSPIDDPAAAEGAERPLQQGALSRDVRNAKRRADDARRLQARLDRQAEIAEMRATIDTQWKVIEALCAAKPDLQARADAKQLYNRVRPRLDKFGGRKDDPESPTAPPREARPAEGRAAGLVRGLDE
jgi:hypothetical protein